MSATQAGEARTAPITTNGNGHAVRKARGPNKPKAKAATAKPATQQTAAPVIAGAAAQPATRITTLPTSGTSISLIYLRDRLARLEIERQTIQSLIAAAGPQRMATPGTTRKATKKRRAKRQQPAMQKAA